MVGYTIRVSARILDEDGKEVYRYSELLRTGSPERVNVIKTLKSAKNIMTIIARDIRRSCLIGDGS